MAVSLKGGINGLGLCLPSPRGPRCVAGARECSSVEWTLFPHHPCHDSSLLSVVTRLSVRAVALGSTDAVLQFWRCQHGRFKFCVLSYLD